MDINPGGGEASEDGTEMQCNAEKHGVTTSGDAEQGKYIWLGLLDHDSLVAQGESKFVTGVYQNLTLSLQTGYWNNLPAGEYDLRVFECTDSTDVGIVRNRSRAATAGVTSVQSYSGGENHNCCTPVREGIKSRAYCRMQTLQEGLTGVSALIEARYGLPCGYPDSGVESMSIVVCAILKFIDNPQGIITISAQVGVGWERYEAFLGDKDIWHEVYVEIYGSVYYQRQWHHNWQSGLNEDINPPADGTSQYYQAFLDTTIGAWSFVIGNIGLGNPSQPDSIWMGSGSNAQWFTEIVNYEDDMAGTESYPCIISEMSIEVNGDGSGYFQEIGYGNYDEFKSDDTSLWKIQRTGASEIRIWDVFPNPLN